MKIEVSNRQQQHRVNVVKVKKLTRWLMQSVQQLEPNRRWVELSLVLTDDDGMIPLNRAYFGNDRPTDVISFHYPPAPGPTPGDSGEVIVNVTRAVVEGRVRGDVNREFALYVAHGCHHLAGETDHSASDRSRMRGRENEWLAEARALGLLEGLLGPIKESQRE